MTKSAPTTLSRLPGKSCSTKASATTLMVILCALLALALMPSDGIGFSLCPFQQITGYNCPGCGLTRSISSALHLEVTKSFLYHPLGIPLILAALTSSLSLILQFSKNKMNWGASKSNPLTTIMADSRFTPIMIALFIGVWIIRMF